MLGNFFQKRNQQSNASVKDNHLFFDDDSKHGKFITKNLNNNEYSQRLNPTTFTNKTEIGNISLSVSNNAVNVENQYSYRNNNYYNNTPMMLDHMSDELKIKLLGSRHVPMANTVDNLFKNSTIQDVSVSKYTFRIIIAEETGQMACRNNYKVPLDFSYPKDSTIEKIRFNELKQYMFGSMVRSNDSFQSTDKFRVIPNSNFILITRIFYYDMVHNRIAISICVSKKLFSVVSELWNIIDMWLNEVEHILMSFIKTNYNNILMGNLALNEKNNNSDCGINNNNLLPTEPSSNFKKSVDKIIHLLQKNVIPGFKYMSEIPRLFIYPAGDTRFVETWFKDVFNWLEIKDGPKLNFLPTLIATILLDVKNYMEDTPTSRLVVMSGNMVVANKLLFIVTNVMKPRFNSSIGQFCVKKVNKDETDEINKLAPEFFTKTAIQTATSSLRARICEDNATIINDGSPNSKISTSSNGWEIPKKASSNMSVSLSSDDSNGEVIQPSSFKSGSSSFKYLSSSLSSQPGSYGSWFNKRPSLSQFIQQSPSIKNEDSWESISSFQYHNASATSNANGTLHKTASTSSLHQLFNRVPNSNQTLQPSPSISEYDEYPWLGTPESPRVDGVFYSAVNNNNIKKLPQNMSLKDIDINRDCQKISQSDIIDNAFEEICGADSNEDTLIQNENGNYNITESTKLHASVLELEVPQLKFENTVDETLPYYTSYLTRFNSLFQVQGIPIAPDSEQHIIGAMKKDLQHDFYSCTTIVSLRTREIKQVMMKRDLDNNSSARNIKQKVKKIFCNGKYGNLSNEMEDCINFVNTKFKEANALCEDLELEDGIRAIRLTQIFLSIINYPV